MYWFNTYEASIRQKIPPLLNVLIHRPPSPSFSPPSPSVILTEGGNPGWCSRRPSRLTDRREGRAWIPGDAPRMTERRKCATCSPPSPSVMLTTLPVRHSHRRWESRLVFSPAFPPDGWEGREGLDSRGCPENDGEEKMRDMLTALPIRHFHRPPRPSFSPPSPSVILTEGGNPGHVFEPTRQAR